MFLTFLFLLKSRPEIVVLNPSLQKRSLVRDYVLSILCRFLNIEYELIWHGWKNELIGIVKSGGFSSQYSFMKHLIEEAKIRVNNNQNIFFVSLIFFNALIKKIVKEFF